METEIKGFLDLPLPDAPRHKEIMIQFMLHDGKQARIYAAVGFLGEKESSTFGDQMYKSTASLGMPIDETEGRFILGQKGGLPPLLSKFSLACTAWEHQNAHRLISCMVRDPVQGWSTQWKSLDEPWNGFCLVLRRLA